MEDNSRIPFLQQTSILCPKCKSIQNTEVERKGNTQFINCTKCRSRWEITFKSGDINIDILEKKITKGRGLIVGISKEPVPLGKDISKEKLPSFGKGGPSEPGNKGGNFGFGR